MNCGDAFQTIPILICEGVRPLQEPKAPEPSPGIKFSRSYISDDREKQNKKPLQTRKNGVQRYFQRSRGDSNTRPTA